MKQNLEKESTSWKTTCPKCKKVVHENDDYHTLHDDNCGFDVNGFCFCDLIFHARCCPECNKSSNPPSIALMAIVALIVISAITYAMIALDIVSIQFGLIASFVTCLLSSYCIVEYYKAHK